MVTPEVYGTNTRKRIKGHCKERVGWVLCESNDIVGPGRMGRLLQLDDELSLDHIRPVIKWRDLTEDCRDDPEDVPQRSQLDSRLDLGSWTSSFLSSLSPSGTGMECWKK
jgi:hypothetical protein